MRRKLFLVPWLFSFAILLITPRLSAIEVVEIPNPNTTVTIVHPFALEDPTVHAVVNTCRVLEWLDADFTPEPRSFGPWTPRPMDDPDNCVPPNQPPDPPRPRCIFRGGGGLTAPFSTVFILEPANRMETETTVASTSVAIHLVGDANDGVAEIFVDGETVAVLNMFTDVAEPTVEGVQVFVDGLPLGTHTIVVENQLVDPPTPLTDDVAILGAAACEFESEPFTPIPALSTWGLLLLVFLTFLLLAVTVTRLRGKTT